ncbi:MAG: aspartate kinase [Candidatus Hydrothermarchaeota archaeon]|nr:aspartate kinase [Candidatus Hydrothermarchaeota archaeon]
MRSVVMKFGGTSLGSGEKIRHVAKMLREKRAKETVVVISAMSGVTDMLVEMSNKVVTGVSEKEIKGFVGEIREKHLVTVKEAVAEEFRSLTIIEIEKLCEELEKALIGVSYVGELTPRSMDYLISFGEKLNAPIVSGALNSAEIKSRWYDGFSAGIVTNSDFGKASPIWKDTKKKVMDVLKPILSSSVPVVTGFIAGDEKGRIATLGRGGSDYTAAILGSALGVEEIWIWTDVNGIMTTDPKLVKEARTINVISFIEAMELAYFGAKVLHPKTIEPAMERGIPVRVRNTFNIDNEGTLIVKDQEKSDEVAKAISAMKDVVLLTISGLGMIGVPGIAARVFTALAKEKVNILMISQGSSEVNISIVIHRKDLEKAIGTIKEEFVGKNVVRDVHYNKDVSIIAVIGAGMRGTKGVAARVFTAVAKAGVNVLMIAQGSSEVNISFVVLRNDVKKAAKALHDEFIA